MGQRFSCFGSTASDHRHPPPLDAASAAAAPAPLRPSAAAASAASAAPFQFRLFEWRSDTQYTELTVQSHPELVGELRSIAYALAHHGQYLDVVTSIMGDFWARLPPQQRTSPSPPTLQEVTDYLQHHFPIVRMWAGLVGQCGMVDKGEGDNAIYLPTHVLIDVNNYLKVRPVPSIPPRVLCADFRLGFSLLSRQLSPTTFARQLTTSS